MRRLVLWLALWPALLHAQNDWLSLPVPQPLSGPARVELAVGLGSGESWGNAQGDQYWFYTDASGVTRTLKTVSVDAVVRARLWGPLVLEAEFPLVFNELSPFQPTPVVTSPLDPNVKRAQGLGDVRLALRGPLFGAPDRFQGGWSLGVVAPTGLGPFDAPNPLVATGAGRWQLLPALVFGGGQTRAFESWLWVQGRWQAGRAAWVSSQAYLAYTGLGLQSIPVAPSATGGVWLDPRWGVDASWGVAWNWYRAQGQRYNVALELLGHSLSPWSINGQDQGAGPERGLWAQPELNLHFGAFNISGGWRSTALLGSYNVPQFAWGQLLVNASYAF